MTSSSSFTSSNSNLNREDSFINLDIFMGEKVETLSTKSQMTDQDINAIKKKFDEFSFEIKQLKNQLKEEKKMASEDRIKNAELASELKKLKEVKAYFVKVPNKWTNIYSQCCDDNCVNDDTLNTTCSNEWGFIQITSDTNIKYNCKPNKTNREVIIAADESFEKPSLSKCCLNCTTYPLYYYEIKLKIEKSKHLIIEIGLCDFDEHWDCIYLCLTGGYISYYDDTHKKDKFINLSSSFSFNNEDIIGCGVVYPPPNINNNNKLPYIFFTKNGELIGKAIEMKGNIQDLWPSVILKCCSIETNFGEDLNSKPFKYDISNHLVIEEFYKEEDFSNE